MNSTLLWKGAMVAPPALLLGSLLARGLWGAQQNSRQRERYIAGVSAFPVMACLLSLWSLPYLPESTHQAWVLGLWGVGVAGAGALLLLLKPKVTAGVILKGACWGTG